MKFATCILVVLLILKAGSTSAQSIQSDTLKRLAQVDSAGRVVADTIRQKKGATVEKHEPRKATLRSALIPGWGQAYNKEYWKIPLAYAAVGVPAGFFIYNNTWYKRSKKALEITVNKDTASFPSIHPDLVRRNNFSEEEYLSSLRLYRNSFRRDRDYAILYFLVGWALQVVDATVFAHLKEFDVSEDLSFQIKPGYSPTANTSGLSLVLAAKSYSRVTPKRR
jgi:hypothetical protein